MPSNVTRASSLGSCPSWKAACGAEIGWLALATVLRTLRHCAQSTTQIYGILTIIYYHPLQFIDLVGSCRISRSLLLLISRLGSNAASPATERILGSAFRVALISTGKSYLASSAKRKRKLEGGGKEWVPGPMSNLQVARLVQKIPNPLHRYK